MMELHAWRRVMWYVVQGRWWHATPDIVSPCLCCPIAKMECHARYPSTVCSFQGRKSHDTLDLVRPCIIFKGDYVMPSLTSFDWYSFQGRWWHVTTAVFWPCVLPKGDDGICHTRRCPIVFATQGQRWHVTPDVSNCVCCPITMMVCHARHRPTMCA